MILKKKRGSVVILLAISSALVIGVSLGVFKMIRSSQDYQFMKTSYTKYQLLASSLKTLISNPTYCVFILKDQKYFPTLTENGIEINSSYFDVKKFVPEMTVKKYVLIPDNTFQANPTVDDKYKYVQMANESINEGAKLYRYKAYLEIWVSLDTGEDEIGLNYRNIGGCESGNIRDCDDDGIDDEIHDIDPIKKLNFNIPLYVNVDDNAEIKSCYGVNTQAYMCEIRGGAWNPDETDLEKKCNPDRMCRSYLPDLANNCPDPSKKIMIGMDNYAGHSNVGSMGQTVINIVRQTVIDAFNSRLGAATTDTRNSISGEVTLINSEKYQKYVTYQNCIAAYNQAVSDYNSCINAPPPPPPATPPSCGSQPVDNCGPVVTYDPLDADAVANEAIGDTATLGAEIADAIMEEMDPEPNPVTIGDTIYSGFLIGTSPVDIVKNLTNEMEFHEDGVRSAYESVVSDHVNDNINSGGSAGTYGSRIHGVAISAIDPYINITAVTAEINQNSKARVTQYISSLHTQRKKFSCEWCNTYRYPP